MTVMPAPDDHRSIATSAAGAASSGMVRPTRRSGRRRPSATRASISGYSWAAMPWLPRISSSHATTRSIGIGGVAASASIRPTWTWRPRLRRLPIDARHVATLPRASIERCAPPPVAADDRVCHAALPGVDERLRAESGGSFERRRRDVDRHDPRAGCDRDLDRREPHAAAAVDRDPIARTYAALGHHGAIGRREAAAEARRGHEVHRIGQPDHVQVGAADCDELGERAPAAEARLELVVADLVIAGQAARALAAGAHERDRDAVTRPPLASRARRPPRSIPANSWPGTCGSEMSVSCPTQPCQSDRHSPVASTRMTAPSGRNHRSRHIGDRHRPAELGERHGAHVRRPPGGQPATGRRIEYSPL